MDVELRFSHWLSGWQELRVVPIQTKGARVPEFEFCRPCVLTKEEIWWSVLMSEWVQEWGCSGPGCADDTQSQSWSRWSAWRNFRRHLHCEPAGHPSDERLVQMERFYRGSGRFGLEQKAVPYWVAVNVVGVISIPLSPKSAQLGSLSLPSSSLSLLSPRPSCRLPPFPHAPKLLHFSFRSCLQASPQHRVSSGSSQPQCDP